MDFEEVLEDAINEKLVTAVQEENLEEVRRLLQAGANVNTRVTDWRDRRCSLLHETRNVEITKELLLHGACVNDRDSNGDTPLNHAAMSKKGLEILRELLKHGAYVNSENRSEDSALNRVVRSSSRNLETIELLMKYKADINTINRSGREPLGWAMGDTIPSGQLLIKYTLINNYHKDCKNVINFAPYKGCCNYNTLSIYLEDCICEVEQMKTDVIKYGHSLYDIVTGKSNLRRLLNNKLSKQLASRDYSVRYPIYSDIIVDKLEPAFDGLKLLDDLSKLQIYTKSNRASVSVEEKKIVLDHDSVYNITEYLFYNDLLNLKNAYDMPDESSNNQEEPTAKRAKIE